MTYKFTSVCVTWKGKLPFPIPLYPTAKLLAPTGSDRKLEDEACLGNLDGNAQWREHNLAARGILKHPRKSNRFPSYDVSRIRENVIVIILGQVARENPARVNHAHMARPGRQTLDSILANVLDTIDLKRIQNSIHFLTFLREVVTVVVTRQLLLWKLAKPRLDCPPNPRFFLSNVLLFQQLRTC